jgi:hypothetical protein
MDAKLDGGGVFSGLLGATTRRRVLVTSDSGDSFSTQVYRSINVADDADLFERLAAGDLHEVDDPALDKTYRLAVPVACHDPKRRVFALYVPPELRWDEVRLRKQLLDELTEETATVPSYVRNFHVVLDPSDLYELPEGIAEEPADDVAGDDEVTRIQADEVTRVQAEPAQDLAASKKLARQRKEIEEEREKLRVEKKQLEDVRERFDRERDQMDEVQSQLQRERTELEQLKEALELERQQLQAAQLNAEQRVLAGDSSTADEPEEHTQVVTDDQFVEISEVADQHAISEVLIAQSSSLPKRMSELVSSTRQRAVKIIDDEIVAVAQVPKQRIDKLFEDDPTFFIQLHDIDGYPVVALLLARLDDNRQPLESYAWPLNPLGDGDRLILQRLASRAAVQVGFYGPTGGRLRGLDIETPLSANVEWILRRANEMSEGLSSTWEDAVSKFDNPDVERLGTMRHNFTRESFADAVTPSQVKLAAGIVGYWSKPDTFEYLVANRSFPLSHFREIQDRVITRAADAGIFLNAPLRERALEIGIAANDKALGELLIANFAESAISIRENDLDPTEQWENWDALLGLGEELGIPADPEVVELAEVSLRRAREADELEAQHSLGGPTIEEPREEEIEDGTLIVAKRSESTGITYFLPGDAVLDTFDDLASMSRGDLELLLNDANGRLEAAQMLIERFDSSATAKVMSATENMNAPEVAALAKFLESKAGALEGELVRAVESGGPSAVYVSARALATVKSTTALPALLEAIQDTDRSGDMKQLADAIADYGDKLVPALKRAIKRDGPGEALVTLLSALEDRAEGTLSQFSKDRSKNLREAAKLARQDRESKSA